MQTCRRVSIHRAIQPHLCSLQTGAAAVLLTLLSGHVSHKGLGPNSVSEVTGSPDFIVQWHCCQVVGASSVSLGAGRKSLERSRKAVSGFIPSVCGLVTEGSSLPWPHPSAAEPAHHRLKLFPSSCFPQAFVTAMED